MVVDFMVMHTILDLFRPISAPIRVHQNFRQYVALSGYGPARIISSHSAGLMWYKLPRVSGTWLDLSRAAPLTDGQGNSSEVAHRVSPSTYDGMR